MEQIHYTTIGEGPSSPFLAPDSPKQDPIPPLAKHALYNPH